MLYIDENSNHAVLSTNQQRVGLLIPRSLGARRVGLLNHLEIKNTGLLYLRTRLFHTFGMRFPIGVLAFDSSLKLIAAPCVVEADRIFLCPRKTFAVAEIPTHCLPPQISLPPLKIYSWHFAKQLHSMARHFFFNKLTKTLLIILLMFLPFIFILNALALPAKTLRLDIGKNHRLDLGSAPRTVEVLNPDVLDVERIGLTNAINLMPRAQGQTTLRISFPHGAETLYQVVINGGGKAASTLSAAGNLRLAREVTRIPGLETVVDDGKVIVTGKIETLNDYRRFVAVAGSHPALFIPSFSFGTNVESQVIRSLKSDLVILGEDHLDLVSRNGLVVLGGVANSAEGKARATQFISAVLPNVIDSIDSSIGSSSIVQVNLQFLEVGKSDNTKFGVQLPGTTTPLTLDAKISPVSQLKSIFSGPTFQIAPFETFIQALQEKGVARQLASPSILTRSNERATFLAGGEVPLSVMTDKGPRLEFKPYGISLAVIPKVQIDGSVWLDLDIEVSSVERDFVVQGNPSFLSRRMNTNVILEEGKTAVLSGLVKSEDSKQIEKFPLLGSIPILGELFKSRRFLDAKSELWLAVNVVVPNRPEKKSSFIQQKLEESEKETQGSLLD